jgi:hypothetical protein
MNAKKPGNEPGLFLLQVTNGDGSEKQPFPQTELNLDLSS